MARLAMCGWESGQTSENNNLSVSATNVFAAASCTLLSRTGLYALRTEYSAYYSTAEISNNFPLLGSPNEVFVRIGLSFPPDKVMSTWGIHILRFFDGGTQQLGIGILNVDGTFQVWRGASSGNNNGTLLAGGGQLLTYPNWSCLEARVVIHDTAGIVTVWANGLQIINYIGNTRTSGANQITSIRVGAQQAVNDYWMYSKLLLDDFAINDTTGSINNGRIGQGGIFPLFPNADTADKDWARSTGANNYSLVNSIPPDEDTTYVTANSVGDRDLYEFGNLTNVNSIDAIAISGRLKTTVGAGAPVGFAMRSGATTGDVASHNVTGQWTTFTDVIEADPNTAAAWTLEAVNSLQAGFTIL